MATAKPRPLERSECGDSPTNSSVSEAEGNSRKEALSAPDTAAQKQEIKLLMQEELREGDTRYLVETQWLEQWKKYVGYVDLESAGQQTTNPGPLRTSNLLEDHDKDILKSGVQEDVDYGLLSESAWRKLASWYGPPTKAIKRKAVCAKHSEQCVKRPKVELYPLRLKLYLHPCDTKPIEETFSSMSTVGDVEVKAKSVFGVSDEVECRLWNGSTTLSNKQQTLKEAELFGGEEQALVLEKRNANGTWPKEVSLTNTAKAKDVCNSLMNFGKRCWNTVFPQPLPGLCGLVNIGNTCFMNSALQCLSNVQPLREYFIGEIYAYREHINYTNPLAAGGEVAIAYGTLIEKMWDGKWRYISPQQIKKAIEECASQFKGNAQHDSQELLTFLLDGIHEDLNLVKVKPYLNTSIRTEGRSDKDIAEESWYYHLRRNQSVIVKLFHGQLKCTFICPQCEKDTRVFEPFTCLPLPIPINQTRSVCVHVVPAEYQKFKGPESCDQIRTFNVKVPTNACVSDVKRALHEVTGTKTNMMMVDVYDSKSYKHDTYDDSLLLSQISNHEEDIIFVLELKHALEDEEWVQVPVYHRSPKGYFRLPMTISVSREQCTFRDVYKAVVENSRIYVKTTPPDSGKEQTEQKHALKPHRESDAAKKNDEQQYNDDGSDTTHDVDTAVVMVTPVDKTCDYGVSGDVDTVKGHRVQLQENIADGEQEGDLCKLFIANKECNFQDVQQLQYYKSHTRQIYISCSWDPELMKNCYDFENINQTRGRKNCNLQLRNCLDLFTAKQTVGRESLWFCPECKQPVQVSRKCDLWKLPEVLLFYFKRFTYGQYRRKKINEMIEFPLRDLHLAPYTQNPDDPEPVYDLFATTNHFGSLGGGHYTAYCKNTDTEKWYCFDDSCVSELEESKVMTSAAYILFYRRRSESYNCSVSDVNFSAEVDRLETKFNTFNSLEVGVDSQCTNGGEREEVRDKEVQEIKQHNTEDMGDVGSKEDKVGAENQAADEDRQCTDGEYGEEMNGKEAHQAKQHSEENMEGVDEAQSDDVQLSFQP